MKSFRHGYDEKLHPVERPLDREIGVGLLLSPGLP